jgi:CubicO group peptidase (beta-lactamase class C family)
VLRFKLLIAATLGLSLVLACDAFGTGSDSARAASAGAPGRARREGFDSATLLTAYQRAAELPKLRSLLVEWRGQLMGEQYFHGATRAGRTNIKSASKSIVAALVGIAIADGHLAGLHQTLGSALPAATRSLDSAKRAITIEDLLTMRAGLQSTSFENYGGWVSSRHWVNDALRRPMVAPAGHDGGPMIYSTASSHLLSAILTRATGTSTYRYAVRELASPAGIRLQPWTTDPQGVYFGGNEMRMTPRDMLAFGRLYLNRGRTRDGTQVIPEAWVDSSLVPRTSSPWSGFQYGYGWWIRQARGYTVYFAWGYGGQFIFVVPSLELVVVATSEANANSRDGGHLWAVHSLLDELIIPAAGG